MYMYMLKQKAFNDIDWQAAERLYWSVSMGLVGKAPRRGGR